MLQGKWNMNMKGSWTSSFLFLTWFVHHLHIAKVKYTPITRVIINFKGAFLLITICVLGWNSFTEKILTIQDLPTASQKEKETFKN